MPGGIVTLGRVIWVLNNKFKAHLVHDGSDEIHVAMIVEEGGCGMVYQHENQTNIVPIFSFTSIDELDNILEEIQRNKLEFKNGKLVKVSKDKRPAILGPTADYNRSDALIALLQ